MVDSNVMPITELIRLRERSWVPFYCSERRLGGGVWRQRQAFCATLSRRSHCCVGASRHVAIAACCDSAGRRQRLSTFLVRVIGDSPRQPLPTDGRRLNRYSLRAALGACEKVFWPCC